MHHAVRVYQLKPGAREAFVEEWREHVVPLRRRFGLEVLDAYVSDEVFVWSIAHDGDFAAAERAYYESPERAAMPNPARHLAEVEQHLVERLAVP